MFLFVAVMNVVTFDIDRYAAQAVVAQESLESDPQSPDGVGVGLCA
jgi:hypothetical protein